MKFLLFKKEFWMQRVDYPIKRWQQFLDVVLTSLLLIVICLLAFFRGAEWNKTYGIDTSYLSYVDNVRLDRSSCYAEPGNYVVYMYYVTEGSSIHFPWYATYILTSTDQMENLYSLAGSAKYYFDNVISYGGADDLVVPGDGYLYLMTRDIVITVPPPTVTPSPTVTPVPDVPPVEVGEYDKYFLLLILLLGGLLVWNFATRSPS